MKGRITMMKSKYKKSGHDDGKMLDLKWLLEESRWCCTKSSRKEALERFAYSQLSQKTKAEGI